MTDLTDTASKHLSPEMDNMDERHRFANAVLWALHFHKGIIKKNVKASQVFDLAMDIYDMHVGKKIVGFKAGEEAAAARERQHHE